VKAIPDLLVLFIILPIWFYLLYQILVMVGATELMFFLFWVYLPVAVFVGVLKELVKDS
jgi:hypothetical protein